MFVLGDDDIERLTKRKRGKEQCDVLRAMGIPFTRRPDGSPAVIADAVRESMGMTGKEKGSINMAAISG